MPVAQTDINTDDEVDIGTFAKNVIDTASRYRLIITVSVLVGIAGGWTAYYLLPKKYEVSMIADSGVLGSVEAISIIDTWNELLKKKEYATLAHRLSISEQYIRQMNRIEAELSNKKLVGTDPNNGPFVIKASISNNAILDSLQWGIEHYLENNEYVKERVQRKLKDLNSLREEITSQINDLTQTKESVQQLLKNGTKSASAFLLDPGSINLQILSLYKERLDIESQIQFIDDLQIIERFSKFEKPDSPKLSICLAAGLASGLLLAILIIFWQGLRMSVFK